MNALTDFAAFDLSSAAFAAAASFLGFKFSLGRSRGSSELMLTLWDNFCVSLRFVTVCGIINPGNPKNFLTFKSSFELGFSNFRKGLCMTQKEYESMQR